MGALLGLIVALQVSAVEEIIVSPLDVRPGTYSGITVSGPYAYIPKGAHGGYTPLHLPVGARIVGVRIWAAAEDYVQKLRVSVDSAAFASPLNFRASLSLENVQHSNLLTFGNITTTSKYWEASAQNIEILPDRSYWLDLHSHPSNNFGILVGHIVITYEHDEM